jgi:hypothetical protein
VTVLFAIWDDPSAGDSLWSEQQNITPDADGLFSVLLGSVSPIPDSAFAGVETYLSIKIGADPELSPRQRLASVPYTYSASSADLSLYSDSTGAITDGAVDFADIGQNGAASGQIMKWDGAAWVASDEGAVPDNDWTLTGNALYTADEWGIARAGNTLYGTGDSTHVNLGVACTTGTAGQDYKYATVSGGIVNAASGWYATVGGGESNTATDWSTIGGGNNNTAGDLWSTVGGGAHNTAGGEAAAVGGGLINTATGDLATVGGGSHNTASGYAATVAGGFADIASGEVATVGGGHDNTASGDWATVPGGRLNRAAGACSFASGLRAKADHHGSFVWADSSGEDFASTAANQFLIRAGGGMGINLTDPTTDLDVNGQIRIRGGSPAAGKVLTSGADGTATWETPSAASDNDWTLTGNALYTAGEWGIARSGNVLYGINDSTHVNLGVACTTGTAGQDYGYAAVGGGERNTASGDCATVGGGYENTASGVYGATVGGGLYNIASGNSATVGGGYADTASADFAAVGGGAANSASYLYTTVGGGYRNTASGTAATVGGGGNDTASGYFATVGGGIHNIASGARATVPGGSSNLAQGDYAFAAGCRAKALHDGAFVWGDATAADFSSTGTNQFLIRAAGGVGVGIDTAYTQLTVKGHITPGDSAAWDLGNSTWWWRDVYSTGGIVSPSDRRLKTDVEDLEYGLEEILKLRPVSFSWKNRKDDRRYIGFIAQEVQPFISEVVNVGDDPAQTLGLRYEKLVPVLVNAVKEQQKTIDTQQAKIDQLERKVTELENLRAELAQMKSTLEQLVDKSDNTDGAGYSRK